MNKTVAELTKEIERLEAAIAGWRCPDITEMDPEINAWWESVIEKHGRAPEWDYIREIVYCDTDNRPGRSFTTKFSRDGVGPFILLDAYPVLSWKRLKKILGDFFEADDSPIIGHDRPKIYAEFGGLGLTYGSANLATVKILKEWQARNPAVDPRACYNRDKTVWAGTLDGSRPDYITSSAR